MKICWTVSTYARPQMLARIIRCFEEQMYANRCMLILDDGGQYENQTGDNGRWRLISIPTRFKSLGAKRNACIQLAQEHFPGVECACPVDDDDLALPWHTEACAAALEKAEWARPSRILVPIPGWRFAANYTGHRLDHRKERLYHPSWGLRISAIERAGWYPDKSGPEDKYLMLEMDRIGVTQADPIEFGFLPSYAYCWHDTNISGRLSKKDPDGKQAWVSLEKKLEPATLEKWEPPFNLSHPDIIPGVSLRPF